MAKPTSIPTWATDPGATADPGATRTATGFITGKKAPAKWFNWLFNRTGAWFSYLDNLHNEPEFLNKNYSWTGVQKLAMGYIANHWGVSGEVLYANPTTGAVELRERTVKVPLSCFVPSWDVSNNRSSWRFYLTDDGVQTYWDMVSSDKALVGIMPLPHQSVVASVRCGVHAAGIIGVGGTLEMTVGLASDMEGFADHESSMIWGTPVTVTAYTGVMTAYPPSHEIDGARHSLAVRFVAPDGGQCRVYWGKTVFADPGPRNF